MIKNQRMKLLHPLPLVALCVITSTTSTVFARSINIGVQTTTFPEIVTIPTGPLGPGGTFDPLPDDGKPPVPGFDVNVLSSDSVEIVWYDKSNREDAYHLYRRANGGAEVLVSSFTTEYNQRTEYPDTGLDADTAYDYRLEAYNDKGARSNTVSVYTDRVPPIGSTVATVRLLSHNVEGLPQQIDPVTLHTECEERTSAFGEWVAGAMPAYTVVGMQELYPDRPIGDVFTCNPDYLLDAARSAGRYQNSTNALLHIPRSGIATGGTSILSLEPMPIASGEAWMGNFDGLLGQGSRQGFLFARVPVPGSDIELDVYVVHIYSRFTDHCDAACQRGELEQLAHRIAQTSGNSGNPVVVLGDFNIPGPPLTPVTGDGSGATYNDILEALLDPRDLWFENHPSENGATTLPSVDNPAGRRIDYIFLPTDRYLTNSPYQLFIRNRDDIEVAMWGWGFGPVADHRGVDALIEIRTTGIAPHYFPVANQSEQEETELSILDEQIETNHTLYNNAEGGVREGLEYVLEAQYGNQRKAASTALIEARRNEANTTLVLINSGSTIN